MAKVFLTGPTIALINRLPDGGVAQLGERCVRNAEVVGSSPIASTNGFQGLTGTRR